MTIHDTGRTTNDGWPVAEPRWHPEQAATLPDGQLPGPVAELLTLWRGTPEGVPRNVVARYAGLLRAGYEVHWIPRPVGEDPVAGPVWRRILDPVL